MADHADTFQRTEVGETTTAAPKTNQQKPAVDNADQAARAEAQREYTVGGDDNTKPAAPASPPAEIRLAAAIARVRASDRPSPFGVSHFPPLPKPPE